MTAPNNRERILPRLIDEEIRESFINYSMSVIVSRALPDVRDGLKPVHRRVLYAMLRDKAAAAGPRPRLGQSLRAVARMLKRDNLIRDERFFVGGTQLRLPPFAPAANARDWSVEKPTVPKLAWWNSTEKPSISRRNRGFTASGVTSRGEKCTIEFDLALSDVGAYRTLGPYPCAR